ncbi:uncharacterized protein PV09_08186 [Verruconis gallopava]|uniref:Major histocompatibility complex, class I n=1 Tax=Verruconis gallopava TaxID=253628 RepID=A0A0D1XDI6_9PEZI|nr:uncharacterized protein PV09_08186 [Verruconis gallopava]KIW00296.1 hypothetical protein PV09_08186 [Verruconis gallopava]
MMAVSKKAALKVTLLAALLLQVCDGLSTKKASQLSVQEIEEEIQNCPLVQSLNLHKEAVASETPSWTTSLFKFIFPSSHPAINALLATLYISGPPNFLLALCPPNVDPNSLSVMVAFAVGGLLGDTLFHLLPEIFLGEEEAGKVKFVMVEPNKNLLLGAAIMIGFMTFVAMDKGLRIATGGEGHSHDHSHNHTSQEKENGLSTGIEKTPSGKAKSRKGKQHVNGSAITKSESKQASQSIKLSAYLNLIADFTHNITDGLAMSSSFYASPTVGATTTMAVFFHEIPHEVGDFALLIQSGFSKRAAMLSQFVTALGALLGTCIGIAVQEFGGNSASVKREGPGLWGTSLQWGDLLLPFTAGTFLYVGTVAVIPEMLETGPNKALEMRKMITQFAAVAAGAGIMLAISWS